jgi:hypothetical protein
MSLLDLLSEAPLLLLGAILLACLAAAAFAGYWLRGKQPGGARDDGKQQDEGQGYIVSAVLGLLALLMGFTFSLAIDRFETRRELVLAESNAIGTAYLRTQLLAEPHRSRLSKLLVDYTDNKIALAKAQRKDIGKLLANDDRFLTDIWAATAAAFDSVRTLPFSNSLIDSFNAMIDLDASRRAARMARIPPTVFVVLLIYLICTAGVLGYVLAGPRSRFAGGFLLVLLTMSLMLIVDIDRPVRGGIQESQRPMEQLRDSFKSQPPAIFDRWRDNQK